MASGENGFSFGLRKLTQKDRDLIQQEVSEFNMPKGGNYVINKLVHENEKGFVAFSGKKIVGFVITQEPGYGIFRVDGLYLRKGYDGKGIGSKLLGKANALAVKSGAKQAVLEAGHGLRVVNGKEEMIDSKKFYKEKTNYREIPNPLITRFRWWIRANIGKKPLTKKNPKPKMGLAPQNRLRENRRR